MPAFISIIIPTFNSYGFMKDTLESLEQQTNKDFEVVISDDCSKDETYLRLFEYSANTEMTMRVYQNDVNKGPGGARNFGLSKAIGEYVTFLDSDDTITPDFVETLTAAAKEYNPDCIIFDYNKCTGKKKKHISSYPTDKEGFTDPKEAIVKSTATCCGKMYRMKMLTENKVLYPELFRHEDFCFGKKAISHSESVYVIQKPLYNYIERADSIMGTVSLENEENAVNAYKDVEAEIGEKYPEETEALYLILCRYSAPLGMAFKGCPKKDIIKFLDENEKSNRAPEENKYFKSFPAHTRRVIKASGKRKVGKIRFYARLKKMLGRR